MREVLCSHIYEYSVLHGTQRAHRSVHHTKMSGSTLLKFGEGDDLATLTQTMLHMYTYMHRGYGYMLHKYHKHKHYYVRNLLFTQLAPYVHI
jgi:hypothetical protein